MECYDLKESIRENEQPDIIVIEFAVNDEGDETKGDCYESLVRKALKLPWKPGSYFAVFQCLQMTGIFKNV